MNRITGRSAFLALLKDEGITHLFGNPGTTELPIMHALKEHPDLTYVLGLQESIVVAMADGYSRASGKLVACNVHVAPGLGNAMGSLFNAKFTGTPMILTAGQQEQGHGLTEPLLYAPLVPMAEPLVKWAVEVTRLEDLPRIVRRAAKVAMTPPTGPVFISLPGDILNAEAGIELGASTRVDTRSRPSDAVLDSLAKRLIGAERPVIIVGDEIVKSDALEAAAAFAQTLGAPVYQQSAPYGAHFLSEHACYAGGLSRDQKQVRALLSKYDLLVVLGADPVRMSVWSEVEPLPDTLPVDPHRPHRLGHGQELRRRDGRAGRRARDAAGADAAAGEAGRRAARRPGRRRRWRSSPRATGRPSARTSRRASRVRARQRRSTRTG